jgi:hypothetical protein
MQKVRLLKMAEPQEGKSQGPPKTARWKTIHHTQPLPRNHKNLLCIWGTWIIPIDIINPWIMWNRNKKSRKIDGETFSTTEVRSMVGGVAYQKIWDGEEGILL